MKRYLGEDMAKRMISSNLVSRKEGEEFPEGQQVPADTVTTPTYGYYDTIVPQVQQPQQQLAPVSPSIVFPQNYSYTYLAKMYDPDVQFEQFDYSNPVHNRLLRDTQVVFESGGNPNAVSEKNAKGTAQFLDGTFQMAKDRGWVEQDADIFNVEASLAAQKGYLNYLHNRWFISNADTETERTIRALGAYNMGEGALKDAIEVATRETGDPNRWIEFAPTETKKYLYRIASTSSQRLRSGYKPRENIKRRGGILYY